MKKIENDFDRLYSMSEVAAILGVTPVTIRTWDKKGKIKTIRTPGNQRRIKGDELAKLLEDRE